MYARKSGQVFGYKKCPKWLKLKYYDAVKGICQECKNHFDKLEIHRINRGNSGGLYTVCPINHKESNVKIVCKSCHRQYHSKEF